MNGNFYCYAYFLQRKFLVSKLYNIKRRFVYVFVELKTFGLPTYYTFTQF